MALQEEEVWVAGGEGDEGEGEGTNQPTGKPRTKRSKGVPLFNSPTQAAVHLSQREREEFEALATNNSQTNTENTSNQEGKARQSEKSEEAEKGQRSSQATVGTR